MPATSTLPSTGAGSKPTSQSVTTHTYTINPIPAGSGPSLLLTDYSVPQFASDGYALTVTADDAVWWESYASSSEAMVRMEGDHVTSVTGALLSSAGPGGTMGSTPNGRAWGAFNLPLSVHGGVDYLFYATANSTQVQPQYGFQGLDEVLDCSHQS